MDSASLQLLIIFSVILYDGIGRSDAEDSPLLVHNGNLNISQITVPGITNDDDLKRLQYDCCQRKTGAASGFCFNSTGKRTIEIEFPRITKVNSIKIQTPDDYSIGYVTAFKMMYKEKKTDPDTALKPLPNDGSAWNVFPNSPDRGGKVDTVQPVETPLMEKLIIQIEKSEKEPCLRMEVMGCLEKNCPVMWDTPIMDAKDTGENENAVKFRCSITEKDHRDGVFHLATWILNDTEIITTEPTNAAVVSTLHQRDLYQHLPDSANNDPNYKGGLKCAVAACKSYNCTGWKSPSKDSNEMLPTVTTDLGGGTTRSVILQRGEVGVPIKLKLNGPPVLFLKKDLVRKYGSSVLVQAVFSTRPDTSCRTKKVGRDDVKIQNTCGLNVHSRNWNASHELILKAVTHGLYVAEVTRKCFVQLKHLDNLNKMTWSVDFTKTQFDITVKPASGWLPAKTPKAGSSCFVNSDPHLKTFDQVYYDVQVPGEYIMYRHSKLGYQINAIFMKCGVWADWWWFGTCACGVAVKAGDDVVVISRCSTERTSNFLKAYVWKNNVLTPGLKVYKSSTSYHVYLPIGTYVTVSMLTWQRSSSTYVNFFIEPSVADILETEGLCGYHNGNSTDDLRYKSGNVFPTPTSTSKYPDLSKYAEQWKEPYNKSIFYGVAEDSKRPQAKSYCACVPGSDSWDCGEHQDAVPCIPKGVTNITGDPDQLLVKEPKLKKSEKQPQPIPKGRKKRAAEYSPPVAEDDEYRPFVFDNSFVPKSFQSVSWPTVSGWTEEKAKKYCEDFLLTKVAVKNCKTFLGKTFETEISTCVIDIKLSDGTTFAKSTLESIISQCFAEAHRYPATTTVLPGGLQKSVLYESLCMDNCNNNGVCKDAMCVCNPGFYGSTCSLTKDNPPNIVYMSRNGLCNTRTRDCTKSFIFGTGHIDSTDLKCRMTPYDHRTGIRDLKGQFTSSAIYINFNMLACPHNEKNGTFLLAVSNNNGQDYSKDELLFLAYDSACHNCSSVDQDKKKATCTQETTGCAVGSACYLDGEVDEESICRICDTNRNISNWSVNTAYSNCTKVPVDNIALIAGVTTAVVLAVAITISVVLTRKFCKSKRSVGSPSAADIEGEARATESAANEPTPMDAERKLSCVSTSDIKPDWKA